MVRDSDVDGRPGPLADFITFRCYGTWLHRDERGSVDREHNVYGAELLSTDPDRQRAAFERLGHLPFALGVQHRTVVEDAIHQVCAIPGWTLHAVNVRTNHLHVLLAAEQSPERVMGRLKAWATRHLIEAGLLARGRRAWSRHGSTRYLWRHGEVERACQYVREMQGADLD